MQIRIPKLSSKDYKTFYTEDNHFKCPDNIIKFTRLYFSSHKIRNIVHQNKIDCVYTSYLPNKDWIVTDGKKVIGWVMNGHFHNYAEVYDI